MALGEDSHMAVLMWHGPHPATLRFPIVELPVAEARGPCSGFWFNLKPATGARRPGVRTRHCACAVDQRR